ncbi:hypothetical protein UY3_18190 [Chelonia mydas]|uniref:Uncharacterized protein n=1 Tax=Chelonia mydas TaxID=8469 RepID=M7AI92_CHEMY|nr:hypothetical protein UY3_18190 [Chelonia mydas]
MERQILEFLSPSPEVVAWKEMRKGEALESLSSQSQMVPVATGGILDLSAQTATCVANTYLFAMPDSIGHRETAYGGSQHIGVWSDSFSSINSPPLLEDATGYRSFTILLLLNDFLGKMYFQCYPAYEVSRQCIMI